MDITFQKRQGIPSLGITFFWRMTIDTPSPTSLGDHFIPELFFDYFFVQQGKLEWLDEKTGQRLALPRQFLKTIHNRPLLFVYSTPLILFGARFALGFAESFWFDEVKSNALLEQRWVSKDTTDLASFVLQITEQIERHQRRRNPYPMFSHDLEESSWLVHFSTRHKRRLYRATFGLSRKEIQNIRHVHSFLEQTCDFASGSPRIIRHVTPDVFYDQPHLNHLFRKLTGFSPVEYFQASSLLQDNLMSASYNENSSS